MNDDRKAWRLTTALVLWAVFGSFAFAQDGDLRVDGIAARDGDSQRVAPRLVMPDAQAPRLELPVTRMPEEDRLLLHRRAADLNDDGLIDLQDFGLLTDYFGPCLADEFCPDFTGDGTVDGADAARLLEFVDNSPAVEGSSRMRVGYVEEAPPAVRAPVPGIALANGRIVRRMELTSLDAGGLRLEFDGMRQPGVEIRVYDPVGTTVLGPYRGDRADENGHWWSPTIFGTTIGVEIVHDALKPGESPPTIARIAYIYAGGDCAQCANGPGSPMSCHNCIACFGSWQNADGRAVGQMSWISGGSCVRCTGALLNRGPVDFSPLFMTANHCISTQTEANTLEIRWLYETTMCDPCGGVPGFNDVPRNNGAELLKRRTSADWALLGLWDPPNITGGAYFLGWSASAWPESDIATGVHHPRTSHKRLSVGFSSGSMNQTFCDSNGNNCFDADVWNVDYVSGTTEPGSSGSPIFDSNRRVRGTLTGGPGGCAPTVSRYGRLDLAYFNLRFYLGDAHIASPAVYVLPWAGDPGNNGFLEQGSSSNPFNTVHEASYAVIASEELRVAPGNYNETMTIWRPMTIHRDGGSGQVVIGAP